MFTLLNSLNMDMGQEACGEIGLQHLTMRATACHTEIPLAGAIVGVHAVVASGSEGVSQGFEERLR
jgi:hypothetical protein